MRNSVISLILLFLGSLSQAQTIQGVVKDTANIPVSYATVILLSLPDTTYVGGTITNNEGQFKLKAETNRQLLLQISSIGYKTLYLPAITGQTITLEQDVISIGEVVIKGNRPLSRLTSDGMQTSVANTVLSEMGTGNEVLKRIPMVTGEKGEFEVLGRGKAKIYINNREVRDPSELDHLNAADIQNVEVISDPGARYDATVPAVIRIKTIKKTGDGFSFNIRSEVSSWKNTDYINQLNTNYRKGDLDVFVNLYYADLTSSLDGNVSQTVNLDTLWRQYNSIKRTIQTNKLNSSIGINYEINKNHFIGFRYDLKTSPQKDSKESYTLSNIYADSILYDKWNDSEVKRTTNKPASQANLYYVGQIGKADIDFNGDYYTGVVSTTGIYVENSEKFSARTINSTNHIENTLLAGKLQLSYPIGKGKLSVGSEYVDITRDDEYINEDLSGFTSKVHVDETNLALFTEYRTSTRIGNFRIGLRYEDAKYDYTVNGVIADDKSRHYRQWFPNASYSAKLGQVGLQMSYTSKVVRPSYQELSSNLTYENRLMVETGNPLLKPAIRQDLSLMMVWKILQASVRYAHQKNVIVTWIDRYENDPKISVLTSQNIHKLPKFLAIITVAPTFGVWKPQLSGSIFKQWLDLNSYGVKKKLNDPLLSVSLENIFEFPGNFIINLDATYNTKSHANTSYLYRDYLLLDCGISKSFLNKSLQVRMAVSDILHENKAANQFLMPQTDLKNLYRFDNRRFSFTVRYHFNLTRSKYRGTTAGEEALKRF